MNKEKFVKSLASSIHYSMEDTYKINEILEKNFFISKKNKEKIMRELSLEFSISSKEANVIYESATRILKTEIKRKIRHPFKK